MKILNELPRVADVTDIVAIDIEMFGQTVERLHRPHGKFACISIMYEGDDVVYQLYDSSQIPEVFRRIDCASWTLVKALYDFRQLRMWDEDKVLTVERPIWDCMLVEQNLFGGYFREFSMDAMVRRYYDTKIDKGIREDFGKMEEMTDEMRSYAADDVMWTLKIRKAQENLKRDMHNYWTCDAPMIWVLLDILPVKVDVEKWKETVAGFEKIAEEQTKDLTFNVRSWQQVKKALLADGISVESTGREVLEPYAEKSELVRKILLARKYQKVASTYGYSWLENSVEEGDLVYANFNITGASTGRMSSSNPNLQNIPRKDFPIYREFFIPQYDMMLAPDVSQQEPRILAYLSKDDNLLEVVKSDVSAHVQVARLIYNDDTIIKDGKDPRYAIGKAINLAIGYGLTAIGLSEQTGLSEIDAQKIIDTYFKKFPGVKYYMTKYQNLAYRDGYVTTAGGRRMYVNPYDFKSENNAINSPIQGGAADYTKLWAINVWRLSRARGIPFSLCMLVHDELVFDVKNEYKDATIEIINDAMTEAGKLYPGIPFKSDMNIGTSWAAHE